MKTPKLICHESSPDRELDREKGTGTPIKQKLAIDQVYDLSFVKKAYEDIRTGKWDPMRYEYVKKCWVLLSSQRMQGGVLFSRVRPSRNVILRRSRRISAEILHFVQNDSHGNFAIELKRGRESLICH
jgi:hypothetical protein